MNHRERLQKRDELETLILQQRIDMGIALRDWREGTAPIDHGWQKLMQWRAPLYALGGLIAVRGVRKPRSTSKAVRRLLTGILLANRGRSLYHMIRDQRR